MSAALPFEQCLGGRRPPVGGWRPSPVHHIVHRVPSRQSSTRALRCGTNCCRSRVRIWDSTLPSPCAPVSLVIWSRRTGHAPSWCSTFVHHVHVHILLLSSRVLLPVPACQPSSTVVFVRDEERRASFSEAVCCAPPRIDDDAWVWWCAALVLWICYYYLLLATCYVGCLLLYAVTQEGWHPPYDLIFKRSDWHRSAINHRSRLGISAPFTNHHHSLHGGWWS